jgi:hypothetical protein
VLSELDHDADGAAFRIRVLDGDRNPLAFFIDTKNHELAGLLFAGDARSFQDEAFDTGGEELCMNDLEHERSGLKNDILIVGGGGGSGSDQDHKRV